MEKIYIVSVCVYTLTDISEAMIERRLKAKFYSVNSSEHLNSLHS